MRTIILRKDAFKLKAGEITFRLAKQHAKDYKVPQSSVRNFIIADMDSMFANATPNRGEWSIIGEMKGELVQFVAKNSYVPYAPLG